MGEQLNNAASVENEVGEKAANEKNPPASQLKRDEIPPFPQFYNLFYTSATDPKPSFAERAKSFMGQGMPKMVVIRSLYNKFLKFEAFDQRMATTSHEMGKNIGTVHKAIHSASKTANTYSNTLEQANSVLHKDLNRSQLQAVAQQMLEKTADMQTTNTELEQSLINARDNIENLQKSLEEIQKQSVTDSLTDINNRMFFDQSITHSMAQATRNNEPLSLVMVDIDHFKIFNDTFGHQTGDQVLRLVAKTIQKTTRDSDIACRYGGEEFIVILPDTDLEGAVILAEKIRLAIESAELLKKSKNKSLGKITASFGVSLLQEGDSEASLIERADMALYAAKRSGRNCVKSEMENNSLKISAA